MSNAITTPAVTSTVLVELRAAEGGEDARLIVHEQVRIYTRLAAQRRL